MITEPLAVSLNYGMFRRKEINGTVKHLMFYDMGAYDTTVSIGKWKFSFKISPPDGVCQSDSFICIFQSF